MEDGLAGDRNRAYGSRDIPYISTTSVVSFEALWKSVEKRGRKNEWRLAARAG